MKKKNDYFEMMETQAQRSVEAAEMLIEILNSFDPARIGADRARMHAIEHAADEVRHDALKKLSAEFITPIERDDLLTLIQILDDVTDSIDEVPIDLYMFCVKKLPDEARTLSFMVSRCVRALMAAVSEFRHFKKSALLASLLIEVNTIESEADEVYVEATRALFTSGLDPISILGLKQIYDGLENCCDLCEHAADIIENTVMNNT